MILLQVYMAGNTVAVIPKIEAIKMIASVKLNRYGTFLDITKPVADRVADQFIYDQSYRYGLVNRIF